MRIDKYFLFIKLLYAQSSNKTVNWKQCDNAMNFTLSALVGVLRAFGAFWVDVIRWETRGLKEILNDFQILRDGGVRTSLSTK